MNEDQLAQIADALEGINNNLADVAEMLESIGQTLDGCISRTNKGNFLCITGNISRY